MVDENPPHPVHYGSHAGGAAEIAVYDHPIFRGNLRQQLRDPLEQWNLVRNKTRQDPLRAPARIAANCIGMPDARSATAPSLSRRRSCTQAQPLGQTVEQGRSTERRLERGETPADGRLAQTERTTRCAQ